MRRKAARLLVVACVALALAKYSSGAVGGRRSSAGLTTIVVGGAADDVVLRDPMGRVSRAVEQTGEIPIPRCSRWEAGNETTLDDSLSAGDSLVSEVVVSFELEEPLVGAYIVETHSALKEGVEVRVQQMMAVGTDSICPELAKRVADGRGYWKWRVLFGAEPIPGPCPVTLEVVGHSRTGMK